MSDSTLRQPHEQPPISEESEVDQSKAADSLPTLKLRLRELSNRLATLQKEGEQSADELRDVKENATMLYSSIEQAELSARIQKEADGDVPRPPRRYVA